MHVCKRALLLPVHEAKPTRGVRWILTGGDVAGVLTLSLIRTSVVVSLFSGSHLLFLPGSEAC